MHAGSERPCGIGTVFEISPTGTLTTLHSFAGSDGSEPTAGLIQAANGIFYGTTFSGGSLPGTNDGMVFSLSTSAQGVMTVTGSRVTTNWNHGDLHLGAGHAVNSVLARSGKHARWQQLLPIWKLGQRADGHSQRPAVRRQHCVRDVVVAGKRPVGVQPIHLYRVRQWRAERGNRLANFWLDAARQQRDLYLERRQWASAYWIDAGSVAGGNQYFQSGNLGNVLSATVSGLPINGSPVYITLYSYVGGLWLYNEYTYTAYNVGTQLAVMQSPAPGSTLYGNAQTFTWTAGSGATAYWLDVGSSSGGNSYYQSGSLGNSLSTIVYSLPANGNQIYVTLWSQVDGQWYYNEYTYTSAP